jgi:AraC-like DNA-binding protein
MIVGFVSDPFHRTALTRAARVDEDVILARPVAMEAVELGFPRLVVHGSESGPTSDLMGLDPAVPVLTLTRERLRDWEATRVLAEVPLGRIDHLSDCLRGAIAEAARDVSWVDRTLADLGRAAGAPLPPALMAFGRRILEFPSHYDDLQPLASALGMSRGALKARFRRRGLPSPYTYLRWFRVIACAHVLSDRSVTVAHAARRLAFTSDGNLCRTVTSLTHLTPTEIRSVKGWSRLLIQFAWRHLGEPEMDGWRGLDDIFPLHVGLGQG